MAGRDNSANLGRYLHPAKGAAKPMPMMAKTTTPTPRPTPRPMAGPSPRPTPPPKMAAKPSMGKSKMQPNTTASAKARSVTLGPNHSFPAGTAKNARLAIGGATRSERAGNISTGMEKRIKTEARAELKKDNKK